MRYREWDYAENGFPNPSETAVAGVEVQAELI